ncbi:MAG: hypothetical protein Q9215_007942 [Flavoplaca cf. flavocitrina]
MIHVVIVGAGLGGLAAAIGIAKAGHQITILEQAGALGEVGAGIQIPPNASRILKKWGLLDSIRAVSVQPSDFILRSYHDGTVLSKQNLVPYAEERYGAPYLHIHRADYHRILVAEAECLGVKIWLHSKISHIDFDEPSVQVVGQPGKFHADIIIGADGLKSTCREAMQGPPPHLTGDLAYRIVVKASDMKAHPGLRDLAEKPAINYWLGPSAHVEMRAIFKEWDPKLRILLGLVQESSRWRLQDSEEMGTWVRGKFALLGDACHASLPYLAQGAALAIEDGAVLGQLLSIDGLNISTTLSTYESIRKARTTRIVKGSAALRDVLHLPDGREQRERDKDFSSEPFEGYPNRWADPVFQPWLFDYDVQKEVDKALSALNTDRNEMRASAAASA